MCFVMSVLNILLLNKVKSTFFRNVTCQMFRALLFIYLCSKFSRIIKCLKQTISFLSHKQKIFYFPGYRNILSFVYIEVHHFFFQKVFISKSILVIFQEETENKNFFSKETFLKIRTELTH